MSKEKNELEEFIKYIGANLAVKIIELDALREEKKKEKDEKLKRHFEYAIKVKELERKAVDDFLIEKQNEWNKMI